MMFHSIPDHSAAAVSRRGFVGRARARAMVACAMAGVANDNAVAKAGGVTEEQMLRAALRHFATDGLGAARSARINAETAFFAGDRAAYDWWHTITRTLDRRLAAESERVTRHDRRESECSIT